MDADHAILRHETAAGRRARTLRVRRRADVAEAIVYGRWLYGARARNGLRMNWSSWRSREASRPCRKIAQVMSVPL